MADDEDAREVAPPVTSFPPLAEQARGLARAAARFVASGMERSSAEEQARRAATCGACEQFTPPGRCRLCGCRLKKKISMNSEHCPVGKW